MYICQSQSLSLNVFLTALDLYCCTQIFSSCCEQGLLSSCGTRASRFLSLQSTGSRVQGLRQLRHLGSVVAALRFQSEGSVIAAQLSGSSSSRTREASSSCCSDLQSEGSAPRHVESSQTRNQTHICHFIIRIAFSPVSSNTLFPSETSLQWFFPSVFLPVFWSLPLKYS